MVKQEALLKASNVPLDPANSQRNWLLLAPTVCQDLTKLSIVVYVEELFKGVSGCKILSTSVWPDVYVFSYNI